MAGKINRGISLAFLDGRYVNVTGDTITGSLQINNELQVNGVATISGDFLQVDNNLTVGGDTWIGQRLEAGGGSTTVNLEKDSAILGYYQMDDNAANTNVVDFSANLNGGASVRNTNVISVIGHISTALTFNGTTDWVDIGDIALYDNATALTVCAWVKIDALGGKDIVMSKWNGSGGFTLQQENTTASGSGRTNTWTIFVQDDAGAGNDFIRTESPTNAAVAGTYQFIAFTYIPNSTTGLRLYIDGVEVLDGASDTTAVDNIDSGAASLRIGAGSLGASPFNGEIDNVMTFNRELAEWEIVALYNDGVGVTDVTTVPTNRIHTFVDTASVGIINIIDSQSNVFIENDLEVGRDVFVINNVIIDGNVGINTASPDAKLQVVGDAKLGDDNTTFLTVESNADTFWTGAGTGLPYGHMYVDGTQSIIVALTLNTPAEVEDDGTTSIEDGWLGGDSNLITFPTGGTEHFIAITKPGVYHITWNLSFKMVTGAANTQIHAGLTVDSTTFRRDRCEAHRTISNNSDIGNMAGSCTIDLPNGNEELSLWIENTTNSNNADIVHGSLTAVMVGGT